MDKSIATLLRSRIAALVRFLAGAACLVGFGQALAGNLGVGAAGFAVNINFQTNGTLTPPGYLPDYGEAFWDRGHHYAYGWNVPNTTNGFERGLCPNKLLDTGHKMQAGGQSFSWKIQVPNGLYDVVVAAGDPAVTNGSRYDLNVENARVIRDCVPSGSAWFFGTSTHIQTWVQDGYLTLANGPGATNNSVCYIQIKQIAPIF
ncbi:MAG TPA: hypothetical protein VNT26_20040, partial [Candidatus Sulfotelmatobacter sp.]|nr:hypothetical protein [Candidatus Sulfotelmatobacter sp.]